MRKIFAFLCSLALCSVMALNVLAIPASAQQTVNVQKQSQDLLNKAGQAGFGTNTPARPGQVLGRIITSFLAFVGTIAFVVFLYGGYLWLTARGNEDQVGEAKKYLFNGTMGAAVIMLAYAASYYITNVLYKASQNAR